MFSKCQTMLLAAWNVQKGPRAAPIALRDVPALGRDARAEDNAAPSSPPRYPKPRTAHIAW